MSQKTALGFVTHSDGDFLAGSAGPSGGYRYKKIAAHQFLISCNASGTGLEVFTTSGVGTTVAAGSGTGTAVGISGFTLLDDATERPGAVLLAEDLNDVDLTQPIDLIARLALQTVANNDAINLTGKYMSLTPGLSGDAINGANLTVCSPDFTALVFASGANNSNRFQTLSGAKIPANAITRGDDLVIELAPVAADTVITNANSVRFHALYLKYTPRFL